MQLYINGRPYDLPVTTLAEVLDHFLSDRVEPESQTPLIIGTAHNGMFIPRGQRQACRISPGDRIEILTPAQGG